MEQNKKRVVMLDENNASEVEPIIERLNGLEELLMIVTDMHICEKIAKEIAVLEQQYEEWQNKNGISIMK